MTHPRLLIALLCTCVFSQSGFAQVRLIERGSGSETEIPLSQVSGSWYWKAGKGGKPPGFYQKLNLQLEGVKITKAKVQGGLAKVKPDGTLFIISKRSEAKVLLLTDQGKIKATLKTGGEAKILNKDCDEKKLKLEPVAEELPETIGMLCLPGEDKTKIAIALPQEVEWLNSNIFEIDGKGERWKIYELTESQLISGKTIGTFEFLLGEKTYKYNLNSIFAVAKETPTDKINNEYKFLLGPAALDFGTDAESGDESSYFIGGRVLTRPSFLSMRFGVDVNIALATSSTEGEESLTYNELRAHTGYRLFEGSSFHIDPRLYLVFSNASNPNTGLKMNHQQAGFGLEFRWEITSALML